MHVFSNVLQISNRVALIDGIISVFVVFLPFTAALAEISEMVAQLHSSMLKMENFQKLHELKKDLIAMDNLVTPERVRILTVFGIKYLAEKMSNCRILVMMRYAFSRIYRIKLLSMLDARKSTN